MADQHARLTELMQARRLELGMKTWRSLAVEAGISYETLRALRSGENVAPGTADAIEKALRWTPGSIDGIFDNGEPTPVERPPADEPPHASRPSLEELAARVAATEQEISALRAERVSANKEIDALRAELRRTRHSETG